MAGAGRLGAAGTPRWERLPGPRERLALHPQPQPKIPHRREHIFGAPSSPGGGKASEAVQMKTVSPGSGCLVRVLGREGVELCSPTRANTAPQRDKSITPARQLWQRLLHPSNGSSALGITGLPHPHVPAPAPGAAHHPANRGPPPLSPRLVRLWPRTDAVPAPGGPARPAAAPGSPPHRGSSGTPRPVTAEPSRPFSGGHVAPLSPAGQRPRGWVPVPLPGRGRRGAAAARPPGAKRLRDPRGHGERPPPSPDTRGPPGPAALTEPPPPPGQRRDPPPGRGGGRGRGGRASASPAARPEGPPGYRGRAGSGDRPGRGTGGSEPLRSHEHSGGSPVTLPGTATLFSPAPSPGSASLLLGNGVRWRGPSPAPPELLPSFPSHAWHSPHAHGNASSQAVPVSRTSPDQDKEAGASQRELAIEEANTPIPNRRPRLPTPGPAPEETGLSLPWVRRMGRRSGTPSMAQALPQGCRVSVPCTFSMKQCWGCSPGPCRTMSLAAVPMVVLPASRDSGSASPLPPPPCLRGPALTFLQRQERDGRAEAATAQAHQVRLLCLHLQPLARVDQVQGAVLQEERRGAQGCSQLPWLQPPLPCAAHPAAHPSCSKTAQPGSRTQELRAPPARAASSRDQR